MAPNDRTPDRIFLISTDTVLAATLRESPIARSMRITHVRSHSEAVSTLSQNEYQLILLDIEQFPSQELDLVNYIKTAAPQSELIILASIRQVDEATHALKNGASFYLIKPVKPEDLTQLLDKAATRIEHKNQQIELEQRVLSDLMAGNAAIEKIFNLALKIAPTSSTVLLSGETGTGKEFFARIIHRASKRSTGNFVPVNCGAIPETLFESELFGHKKGSFTGADKDKTGLVEEANMGTLFLDEVGELSPTAQVKFLRFLQDKVFRRIGETVQRTVDVRIVAATNKDLPQMVADGKFREDLFYRLNVFMLNLPPLRQRKETVPNLIRLFVHKNNTTLQKHITKISKPAEILLANYEYPGNVRELENIVEHAMVMADTSEITEADLPEAVFRNRLLLSAPVDTGAVSCRPASGNDIRLLTEIEKEYIRHALEILSGNYSEAAKKLGISRSTLWRKIKQYNLT